jgi:tryptophan halogenase
MDDGRRAGPNAVWDQYHRLREASLGALGEQCLSSAMASKGRVMAPRTHHRSRGGNADA